MSSISRMRSPVQRHNAENYLFITLISFAVSVALTRLFLELTGYPQIGGGKLHVAHVLWGGLLLFVGALFPLIYANRWALNTSAVLTGFGVGLFIDEVGKFITQNNDYFYPAAAPIIYALFLLTVLVYLRVRRTERGDARTELYTALDGLQEVLDHDMDEGERNELEARLKRIVTQPELPDLAHLANELLEFVRHSDLYIAPDKANLLESWQASLHKLESRYMPLTYWKALLTVALGGLGMVAFAHLGLLISTAFTTATFQDVLHKMAGSYANGVAWFLARVILEGLTGVAMLCGAGLILLRRTRVGLLIGFYSLLISLAFVNLLVFYFDQFSTIVLAILQFVTLLGVRYVQRKLKG
jgi:hypothetical protein